MSNIPQASAESGDQDAGLPRSVPVRLNYPIEEAFSLLGVDRVRGYKLINTGLLLTIKHGRRRYASARAINECIRVLERATAEGHNSGKVAA